MNFPQLLQSPPLNVLVSTLTTRGDLVRRGASAPERVALGAALALLKSDGTDAIWGEAGQIAFPASQNAAANANTLDDYEEGTFTPGLTFGGGSTGMTFASQSGQYTKFGRLVMATARIVLTAKGSSTGSAKITGLPFTSSITTLVNGGNIIYYTGTTSMAAGGGWMLNAATEMQLVIMGATSGTDLTHANFNNNTDMVVTALYNAAT